MAKTYFINEIFHSLQGEGLRQGQAVIFLRFGACNLSCSLESHGFDCDTEFASGRKLSQELLIKEIDDLRAETKQIVITGGEPLLQLDAVLCKALKSKGYFLAIETNGSIEPDSEVLEQLDWICCSPKVAEHAIRLSRCDELKYVRSYGQALPQPSKNLCDCPNKLISPAFEGDGLSRKTLEWCIELVKSSPDWRLSVQIHKFLAIR